MSDITEHLMELKGEMGRMTGILEGMSAKLDEHVDKSTDIERRVFMLETPISAVSVGKATGAFAAFTAAIIAAVLGILKLLGRDSF